MTARLALSATGSVENSTIKPNAGLIETIRPAPDCNAID